LSLPSNVMFLSALMSAGLLLGFAGADDLPSSLFKSNLSAFQLNLMFIG
jgi:hypothetical protein